MQLSLSKIVLLAAGVAVILVGIAGGKSFLVRYGAAVQSAESARTEMTRALAVADSANRAVRAARDAAENLDGQRKAAVARADSAARVAVGLRSRLAAQIAVAPDTCRPIIAAANAVIAAQDSEIVDLRGALAFSQTALGVTRAALDTTQLAMDRLRSAGSGLSRAVVTLEKNSRPSFFARLIPKPGIGVAVGIDAFGRPNTTTGITLGWSF